MTPSSLHLLKLRVVTGDASRAVAYMLATGALPEGGRDALHRGAAALREAAPSGRDASAPALVDHMSFLAVAASAMPDDPAGLAPQLEDLALSLEALAEGRVADDDLTRIDATLLGLRRELARSIDAPRPTEGAIR